MKEYVGTLSFDKLPSLMEFLHGLLTTHDERSLVIYTHCEVCTCVGVCVSVLVWGVCACVGVCVGCMCLCGVYVHVWVYVWVYVWGVCACVGCVHVWVCL